jgi:hypothetical protein
VAKQSKTTHVLMVVDMSGSMTSLAADVRGGFNEYVRGLRADGADYRLTATVFDTEFISLAVDAALDAVPELDGENYQPRGMTALLDAVGKTIVEFEAKHGEVTEAERVLVVISTDGQENSSNEFDRDRIKAMIAEREKTGRWGFIYLGAGADAWSGGNAIGLGATSVATNQTAAGTRSTYSGLLAASSAYSKGASIGETFSAVADADGVADESVK